MYGICRFPHRVHEICQFAIQKTKAMLWREKPFCWGVSRTDGPRALRRFHSLHALDEEPFAKGLVKSTRVL